VIDLTPKGDESGIVQFKTELKNQRDEVVNVHESKILVAGRPKDDPTVERR
jgi:acyl dehydratase